MANHKRHIGRWVLVGLILLLLPALIHLARLFLSHGSPKEPFAANNITIMTYNTDRMGSFRKAEINTIIRNILDANADIVCLQEVEVYKDRHYLTLPELRQALHQYGYTYFDFKIYNHRRQYGLAVFSRYELIHKTTIRYASVGNISDYCDVVMGTDTFRLFNNHLESNRLTNADLPDSLSTRAVRSSAQRINEKIERARPTRRAQAQAIRQAIDTSPYPVVVVGDFNSLPSSYVYHHLRWGSWSNRLLGKNNAVLQDAFLCTSWLRTGNTFRSHGIGIRIDYVLCSREFEPLSTRIPHYKGSDHYPLITTLHFQPNNSHVTSDEEEM